MASKSATKSDAPVAARETLAQSDVQADPQAGLKDEAKSQEQLQQEQLQAGTKISKDEKAAHDERERLNKAKDVGAVRRSVSTGGIQNGFIDQLTRKDDGDALEGHFCDIDLNNKDAKDALEAVLGAEPTVSEGGYGVYLEPGSVDPDTGRPVMAVVRLRGAANARVSVPYEALSPAEAGRR